MNSCAFLSMDDLDDFVVYDHLLYEPFEQIGWEVEEVSWRNTNVNWNSFDAVLIRSPWDYQNDPKAFLDVLKQIDKSSALLENSLELIKWNIDKTYLQDLCERGVEIVPSRWYNGFREDLFPAVFEDLNANEIVLKPTISAGADNTFRIHQSNYPVFQENLAVIFDSRPFIIQPFMNNITSEGEFSVFFFGDTYSHTVLKKPQPDDFRVQEEHGGQLQLVEPESYLLETARKMRDMIQPEPLYTRADYVRTSDNTFALMELELIEPSLYFNMDPQSPKRFAQVFDKWMDKKLVAKT